MGGHCTPGPPRAKERVWRHPADVSPWPLLAAVGAGGFWLRTTSVAHPQIMLNSVTFGAGGRQNVACSQLNCVLVLVLCQARPCRAVPCRTLPCCAVAVQQYSKLCCAVLCCAAGWLRTAATPRRS